MHVLFVQHIMVQTRHESLPERTELTCCVWHGTVEEACPEQLQVLCHLGLLKPGIHTGPVVNNWQVLGVLPSSRDVMWLEAAWGKATPRHYPAKRCCHGGAGWHPAISRELWLRPKSFISRQGDRTKLSVEAWVKSCTIAAAAVLPVTLREQSTHRVIPQGTNSISCFEQDPTTLQHFSQE